MSHILLRALSSHLSNASVKPDVLFIAQYMYIVISRDGIISPLLSGHVIGMQRCRINEEGVGQVGL